MSTHLGPTPQGNYTISTTSANTAAAFDRLTNTLNGFTLNGVGCIYPNAADALFPDDQDCPACGSCKNGHKMGSVHWAGREHVMLFVCANCNTSVEIEELPGGFVAYAIQQLSRNMLERIHEGEDIPGDDAALLDWLNERLADEQERIDDAKALVETMQLSLRCARSTHR